MKMTILYVDCFFLQAHSDWRPTWAVIQQPKTNKLANLSERRFGAHIDASGVWRLTY